MFFIYNSLLGFDSHVKILNVFLLTASGVSAFQRFSVSSVSRGIFLFQTILIIYITN